MVDLFRSKSGATVHATRCPTRGQRVAWLWAKDKTLAEVHYHLWSTTLWVSVAPCHVCAPFAALDPLPADLSEGNTR